MALLELKKQKRSNQFRLLIRLSILAVFFVLIWLSGLFWFADKIPKSVIDLKTRTDAIAVLTGGKGRLEAGFSLLESNLAKKLFISGVYRGVEVNHLLELFKQNPGDLKCCLEIGRLASNTTGNAIETAAWLKNNDFKSLRIVTSGYHIPRTMLEFDHILSNSRLIPHPVFSDHVKHERWWAWPGTFFLIVGEYNKYLLAVIRIKLKNILKK